MENGELIQLEIWGCRGTVSIPMPPSEVIKRMRSVIEKLPEQPMRLGGLEAFLNRLEPYEFGGYGQLTRSLKLTCGEEVLIIGGGTGIRPLGYRYHSDRGRRTFHIVLNSLDWGNLLGLGFFIPIFIKGNHVHFHSPLKDVEMAVRAVFSDPYFPLPFDKLGAEITFEQHPWNRRVRIAQQSELNLSHPKGFEISFHPINEDREIGASVIRRDGVSIGQIVPFTNGDLDRLDFIHGLDLLQVDAADLFEDSAQFTVNEAFKRLLDEVVRNQVKQVLVTGYGAEHTDYCIHKMAQWVERYRQEYFDAHQKEMPPIAFAREDAKIPLNAT